MVQFDCINTEEMMCHYTHQKFRIIILIFHKPASMSINQMGAHLQGSLAKNFNDMVMTMLTC